MATAGEKVTVACKIGVPWFELQLCEKMKVKENTQTGPREVEEFRRTGKIVRVRGTSYPRGTAPAGFPSKPQMINGYALTHGVDKAFWDEWLAQNKNAPFVRSGMITAHVSLDAVKGHAKDHVGKFSGLEPMRINGDPRVPRPVRSEVSAVQVEDGHKGKIPASDLEDA